MGSIYLFLFLFIVTFLIHKPFNVHSARQLWLIRLHYGLERAVWMQLLIVINHLFKL